MEKIAITTAEEVDYVTEAAEGSAPSVATSFERPSIEEVSLCCEISAYAPDEDSQPLF